jgi:hypothetical protein
MDVFLKDLRNATECAAKELRKAVVNFEEARFHREQRQEAQLVAEVYHYLRSNCYFAKDLFMEYLYPRASINGKQKKLKPDLIFENNGADHVVEFGVFWDADLYLKNSILNQSAKNTVENYYEKILSYSELRGNVAKGYLVFAFLGPDLFESGKRFNQSEFVDSLLKHIDYLKSQKKKTNFPVEVIVS